MINTIIADVLNRIGHTWKLDSGFIEPDENDVEQMLDAAAATLYDGVEGDRFEAGGLIIEKRPNGHDVYVYVGNYQ